MFFKKINGLRVTARTVRKYFIRLGSRTVRTKYCQFVSNKNRYKKLAKICLLSQEKFYYFIFIWVYDWDRHGSFFWAKDSPNQIKLVVEYSHEASIHIIGAISRRGRSKLFIFHGSLNSNDTQYLGDQFLLPFIRTKFPDHHNLYIDGAGHHTSDSTMRYFYRNNIN